MASKWERLPNFESKPVVFANSKLRVNEIHDDAFSQSLQLMASGLPKLPRPLGAVSDRQAGSSAFLSTTFRNAHRKPSDRQLQTRRRLPELAAARRSHGCKSHRLTESGYQVAEGRSGAAARDRTTRGGENRVRQRNRPPTAVLAMTFSRHLKTRFFSDHVPQN